uniref:Uncharacterized protein n=1 Tax=Timema tahoe TaxID=61484 RepID=A0A7R9NYZ8_9NEOP|nr:unnamed protein product [Timema tahoe]
MVGNIATRRRGNIKIKARRCLVVEYPITRIQFCTSTYVLVNVNSILTPHRDNPRCIHYEIGTLRYESKISCFSEDELAVGHQPKHRKELRYEDVYSSSENDEGNENNVSLGVEGVSGAMMLFKARRGAQREVNQWRPQGEAIYYRGGPPPFHGIFPECPPPSPPGKMPTGALGGNPSSEKYGIHQLAHLELPVKCKL